MATDLTKQLVVFRSGNLTYFEWACGVLKDADIPFFTRELTSGGLTLAMPVAPAGGPGISWAIVVPEASVPEAKKALEELPFEIGKEAGVWDFQPTPPVKAGWKIYSAIMLAIVIGSILLNFISQFRRYR